MPAQQQAIDEMTERYRCRIHTFAADVGDEAQVSELLERIRAELPPLAGVVHVAGVLDDALLPQQNVEHFRTTLAPKAFGARHLDRLTKDDELEFFVVYSSGAQRARLARPGQLRGRERVARRARCATARRKACPRRASTGVRGRRAAWQLRTPRAPIWVRKGLIPLEPTAALNALGEIIAHGTGQATVLKANWQRAAKLLGGSRPPILDHVLPSAVAATRR